ncbi:MAG TPA: universal stress protein [Atopostipes sp.]|nr:universal stress protein [Atopostipes sp.]
MKVLYPNILIPVDGSQQSINAFKNGIEQAKAWGSKVYLVQVLSNENVGLNIEERKSFLKALEDYAEQRGVKATTELVYGDPRKKIASELVDQWDIDLIIIGATGKGRIAKMVVGSVTNYVIRHANCNVLVSR